MGILGKLVSGFKSIGKKVTDNLSVIGKKIGLSKNLKPNFDFSRMTKEMKLRAKMAQLAYEPEGKRPKELEGFKLDEEFNKKYHVVYVGNVVYLVYRGTSPTDLRDLKSDYDIVLGKESKNERFEEALRIADKVHQKYPKKTMVTTGHSLGGTLASHVARSKSYVKNNSSWNPGAGKGALERSFRYATGLSKGHKRGIVHKVLGDAISMSAGMSGQKLYTYPTRGLKSHSIDNFV